MCNCILVPNKQHGDMASFGNDDHEDWSGSSNFHDEDNDESNNENENNTIQEVETLDTNYYAVLGVSRTVSLSICFCYVCLCVCVTKCLDLREDSLA